MGCGKTLTAIAIAGVLWDQGRIERVLVVAPTSVVAVWPKEFEEYADFAFTCETMLGTKSQRLKALSNLRAYRYPKLKVAVINYESTWRDDIFEALQGYDADLIICDESQRIKAHDSHQSKAMHLLGDQARYKLILSGTPVQQDVTDLWSQYRFLDRSVFGDQFYAFKGRYCRMGGYNNKKVLGVYPEREEELIRKEYSIAFRVTKAEALDLPEQTFETRYVQLSAKERELYDQIRLDSYAELEGTGEITATTALIKILRLQQLCGGFIATDDGKIDKPVPVGTSKLDALADIIEDYVLEGGKKLVVFAFFVAEVKAIISLCDKLLKRKRKRAVYIYGAVKKEDRGGIVKQFQEDPDAVVFIGQIDTAGTGITLTAADTCVYYSKSYNYATFEQSLARIHRIGQINRCTYISLVTANTVDERISKALKRKENIAKNIVDSWKDFF